MNYHQQLRLKREIRAKQLREGEQHERALVANAVISNYEAAYEAAYGGKARVTYRHGWYEVYRPAYGLNRYRRDDVVRMAETLWARVHETELNAPVDNE